MSSQRDDNATCAFTAPFLCHHNDPAEAEILRRAGEILLADREEATPRKGAGSRETAELWVMELAEELSALAHWIGQEVPGPDADTLAALLLEEEGDVEGAYAFTVLASIGRHLGALATVLEEAESHTPETLKAWREKGSPSRVAIFRGWIATMAAVMRRWGPVTRDLAEWMIPELPDPKTRQMMMEANMESPEVELFHFKDSIIGDILSRTIASLESIAGVSNLTQSEVHRQLDPQGWADWEGEPGPEPEVGS